MLTDAFEQDTTEDPVQWLNTVWGITDAGHNHTPEQAVPDHNHYWETITWTHVMSVDGTMRTSIALQCVGCADILNRILIGHFTEEQMKLFLPIQPQVAVLGTEIGI